jgi:hypothetical protein
MLACAAATMQLSLATAVVIHHAASGLDLRELYNARAPRLPLREEQGEGISQRPHFITHNLTLKPSTLLYRFRCT